MNKPKNKILTAIIIAMLVSVAYLSLIENTEVEANGITRIQGNARGTGSGASITVTLAQTPVEGNVLVATVSTEIWTIQTVDSISQTGVTWSKQKGVTYQDSFGVEIWFGVVGSGAGTVATITFTGSVNAAVGNICEYSGIATTYFLDKTASATGTSTQTDTGTTAETTQADELWIGSTFGYYQTQSNPTNGFTLLDGDSSSAGNAFLEKIVSEVGTANSGTTIASAQWCGCIVTLKAVANGEDLTPPTFGTITANTTIAGNPVQLSCAVNDETEVSGSIFSWNNTESWTNQTWTAGESASLVGTLNGVVGNVVSAKVYANDTSDNWGTSSQYNFTLTSVDVVTLTIANPQATTYSYSIPVQLSASGGTIDKIWYNVKNGSDWVYAQNQTYTSPTNMINFVTGTYTFYGCANNTGGSSDEKTVVFNVLITAEWFGGNYTGYYNVTATSGSVADIQSAVDDVYANGIFPSTHCGNVFVPAGTFHWNGETVTIPSGINVFGASPAGCKGHEDNWEEYTATTILHNDIAPESMPNMFYVDGWSYQHKPSRISGIQFEATAPEDAEEEALGSNSAIYMFHVYDFRVDHCTFINFDNIAVFCDSNSGAHHTGNSSGVIDHCVVDNPYKLSGSGWLWGYGFYARGDWVTAEDWDSDITHFIGQYNLGIPGVSVMFVEDCHLSRCRHATDGLAGAWDVVRYCLVDNSIPPYGDIGVHGATSDAWISGRGFEAYNNTVYDNSVDYPYGIGFHFRGGSGFVFDNYFAMDVENLGAYFCWLSKEGTDPNQWVTNTYIWDNTYENCSFLDNKGSFVLNVDYFLRAPTQEDDGFTYTPYVYPHTLALPLGGEASEVTVTIVYPQNTTYSTSTIPVQIIAGGGTIDTIWYNVKNASDWVYVLNQTYTSPTSMTGFVNGAYTFYGWANNTDLDIDEKTVEFTVSIIDKYYFNFNFRDLDDNNVKSVIVWKLWNSTQELTYTEGQSTLLSGTFTLKTSYKSVLINSTNFDTVTYGNSTVTVFLTMAGSNGNYIASNNTAAITINEWTSTTINFTATGAGTQTLVIPVAKNATSVTKNGVPQDYGTVWIYDSGTQSIVITSTLSTWVVTFATTPPAPPSTLPPSGVELTYTVTFRVAYGSTPISNAIVTFGASQTTTNTQGLATFLASAGTYPVAVIIDGEIKYTSQVTINSDATFSINLAQPQQPPTKETEPFPVPVPSIWDTLKANWFLIAIAIGIIVVGIIIIRKRQ